MSGDSRKVVNSIDIFVIVIAIGFVLYQGSLDYTADRASKSVAEMVKYELEEMTGSTERSVGEIELIIRKMAHVVEYMLMGTVILVGLGILTGRKWVAVLLTLMIAVPIPFIDEFIVQTRAEGRSVQYLDIVLDEVAILMAILVGIVYLIGLRNRL